MASPRVGSPITSCQCSTGIWLVTMVAPFGLIENRETPVIEDQQLNAAEGFEQAAIATVAASEGKRLKQARHAMVLDRAIVAASLVAEGAGNPTLA